MKWHYSPEIPDHDCECLVRLKEGAPVTFPTNRDPMTIKLRPYIKHARFWQYLNNAFIVEYHIEEYMMDEEFYLHIDQIEKWCSYDEIIEELDRQ